MVEFVDHRLQDLAPFRIEGLDRRTQVDVLARFDGNAHDIELRHQILEVIHVENAADRSRDTRRMRDDHVAARCQIVGAAGGDVHQASDDRQPRAPAKSLKIVPHDVGRGNASAGRMDPQDHGPHARIALDCVEPFAKQRNGVLTPRSQPGGIGIQEQAIDIDDSHQTFCGFERWCGRSDGNTGCCGSVGAICPVTSPAT